MFQARPPPVIDRVVDRVALKICPNSSPFIVPAPTSPTSPQGQFLAVEVEVDVEVVEVDVEVQVEVEMRANGKDLSPILQATRFLRVIQKTANGTQQQLSILYMTDT